MELVKVTIDGKTVEVPSDFTVIEAAAKAGIRIPQLCYHPELAKERRVPRMRGRDSRRTRPRRGLRISRLRRHGRTHQHAQGARNAQSGRRAPARQPPAGLPLLPEEPGLRAPADRGRPRRTRSALHRRKALGPERRKQPEPRPRPQQMHTLRTLHKSLP